MHSRKRRPHGDPNGDRWNTEISSPRRIHGSLIKLHTVSEFLGGHYRAAVKVALGAKYLSAAMNSSLFSLCK
jgi:hypothetical protein